ncbi:hypothetical protein, partial [Neisseria sp. P0009.S003]|uniref:hypothetical protein n=1 Tax=Neisseria sp. P0009.S003 TaxID=3436710 RepID=UPI003F7F31C8
NRRRAGHSLSPPAFGRLCVETTQHKPKSRRKYPAAFGRLCVETFEFDFILALALPAAFGRLCVGLLYTSPSPRDGRG